MINSLDTSLQSHRSNTCSTFSTQSSQYFTNCNNTYQLTLDQKQTLDDLLNQHTEQYNEFVFNQNFVYQGDPKQIQRSKLFWQLMINKIYVQVFKTVVLTKGLIMECLVPSGAPSIVQEVLNSTIQQMIYQKVLVPNKQVSIPSIQINQNQNWSDWLWSKVSCSKKLQSFAVIDESNQMLTNQEVLITVCNNLAGQFLLKDQFKKLLARNFNTELEVKIIKDYLKLDDGRKTNWLHYHGQFVKISPNGIDKLDIVQFQFGQDLLRFKECIYQLQDMDLCGWKQQARNTLADLMQHFHDKTVTPTLQTIRNLDASGNRLHAYNMLQPISSQLTNDFETVLKAIKILEKTHPQHQDYEFLRQVGLI